MDLGRWFFKKSDRPIPHTPAVYKEPMSKSILVGTEAGFVEVDFPSYKSFLISAETQATPIDQFYWIVVFRGLPIPKGLAFDQEKIHVHPEDYQRLYDLTISYFRKFFKDNGATERTNDVWERFAPTLDPNVLQGKVRLLDGYIRFA